MRIGIIFDGSTLKRWQYDAIRQVAHGNEFYLMIAHGERAPKRKLPKHAAYYALNVLAMRSRQTRRVPFPANDIPVAGELEFTVDYDGAWASLPQSALDFAIAHRLDAILKFSLNLLRIPTAEALPVPILSYHHGDPRHYRGRPAGFYETADGVQHVGQIVQVLCNTLDAGEILAAGHTPVLPWSYKQTLAAAYRLSPRLLPQALDALRTRQSIDWSPEGRNYRLPSNLSVVRFGLRQARAALTRGLYGAFVEKRWQVSFLDRPGQDLTALATDPTALEAARSDWRTFEVPKGYMFLADPFFARDGTVMAEALSASSGTGHLVSLDPDDPSSDRAVRLYDTAGGHLSYPSTFAWEGREWLLPETAHWARPHICALEDRKIAERLDLDIDVERMLDPTMLEHDGTWYLFGNLAEEGPEVLRLWHGESPADRFEEHPQSPIRASIRGSRMGGALIETADGLVRIGQDRRAAYGDGLCLFAVTRISPSRYEEREIARLAFERVSGPHTLNLHGDRLLFDWYADRVSPLAGVRRVSARLRSRRAETAADQASAAS